MVIGPNEVTGPNGDCYPYEVYCIKHKQQMWWEFAIEYHHEINRIRCTSCDVEDDRLKHLLGW